MLVLFDSIGINSLSLSLSLSLSVCSEELKLSANQTSQRQVSLQDAEGMFAQELDVHAQLKVFICLRRFLSALLKCVALWCSPSVWGIEYSCIMFFWQIGSEALTSQLEITERWAHVFDSVLNSFNQINTEVFKWKFTSNTLKLIHPQATQDGDELVSSAEQIWRNVALHHLLTNGQWMGAVRMRVQTADKTSHNPHYSSPSVNILWSEKLHICNKQFLKVL